MDFTIYSIGDSLFLEQVMIALAMIAGIDDFTAMVQVGLLVGVFSVVISGISTGGQKIEFQHVLLGFIIYATMFVPTARVLIEDTYTGQVRIVDDVPIGPAAAGGIISLVGYKLTELFEQAYAPIVPAMTENEFSESLRILTDIRNKSMQSAIWNGINEDSGSGQVDLQKSWTEYIKDCTLTKIDLGLITAHQLYTSSFEVGLEFDSNLYGTQLFINPGSSIGVNYTCADAWDALQATTTFDAETTRAFNSILGLDANNLGAGDSSITKTNDAIAALIPVGMAATRYIKLAVLEPILGMAAERKYKDTQDLSGAMMVNQALQQRNTQWATEQTLFMSIVRPMLAFFEAFIYAISPIMAFVIVLGAKGIQLAGKYFALLIWIQLWMPLLSIVNLYVYSAASRAVATYGTMGTHNWDSFYSLNAAADTMQHWIATGGLLAASTPAIALMLIYGSAVTATHLAGRLKSSDVVDEGYVSPDIKNNPGMANIASMHSGNYLNGMMMTGSESMIGTAQISTALSKGVSSTEANLRQSADQYTDTLGHSITSGQTEQQRFDRAEDIGRSVSAGNSQIAQNASSFSKGLAESGAISHDHKDAVTGAAVASIDANGSFNAAKFSQIMGAAGIGLKAGAGLAGNMQSTSSDGSTQTSSESLQAGMDYKYSDNQIAKFGSELSSSLKDGNTLSKTDTWGTQDSQNLTKSSSELESASDTYQKMSALNTSFQGSTNFNLREVGSLAAGRHLDGYNGNTAAQDTLYSGMTSQPQQVQEAAQNLYSHYRQLGMEPQVAQNTASLTALLSRSNYSNESDFIKGSQLAGEVISQSTGQPTGAGGYGYENNSALQDNAPNNRDVKATATIDGPPLKSSVDTSSVGDSVTNATPPASANVEEAHNQNIREVKQDGLEKERSISSSAANTAARNIGRDLNMSTSASTWGAYDNANSWLSRRSDEVGGGINAASEEKWEAINDFTNGDAGLMESAKRFLDPNAGVDAYNQFIDQYGEQFKGAVQQYAVDHYGLTSSQAAVFAESFDTNDQPMQQRIAEMQQDYMTPDGKGGMELTDANRQLTEDMADRIVDASGAGERAGSYLQDVRQHNIASRKTTPNG